VYFTITLHAGFAWHYSRSAPPTDAIALLWARLEGTKKDELVFAKVGDRITVRAPDEPTVHMTRGEWIQTCRRAVMDLVSERCEQSPQLEWDWFALSAGE
jgi:hypothetical protein